MNEAMDINKINEDNVIHPDFRQPRLKFKVKDRPPTDDWLSSMKPGTEFVTYFRQGTINWLLSEWTFLGWKEGLEGTGGVCWIVPTQEINNIKEWKPVDPINFCKAFELRGITEIPEDIDE